MGVVLVLNKNLVTWKEVVTYKLVPGWAILISVPWYKESIINVLAIYAPNWESENVTFWNLLKDKWCMHVSNKQEGPVRCWLTHCSNPEHAPISDKHEWLARFWLTCCSKSRACSYQQQAGRDSQMLTYNLLETQSMLLSETSRKGQPNAYLHPVQSKTQIMLLLATSREGQA